MKISKRVKIAGAVIVVVIVAFAAFMIFGMSDVVSNLATGAETLHPNGTATGEALVLYDQGLSGAPKDAATKIAGDLQADGYEVVLAGIKSSAAANVSGYDVIVAGGPIYGGKVSSSIWSFLQALTPPAGAKVGAFAIGEGDAGSAFPAAVPLKAKALLASQNEDARMEDFVAALLR